MNDFCMAVCMVVSYGCFIWLFCMNVLCGCFVWLFYMAVLSFSGSAYLQAGFKARQACPGKHGDCVLICCTLPCV